ncbi:MAG: cobalamin-binding protein [Deltaproteobacteria bacterium]|nr:cobalamin-binding protein [Deltaproteobacteria bacterium]
MNVPQRIVSLLPSSTEILCALGLREQLVGVSHECDYPADVTGLPRLTEPKLNPHGFSGEIDARVRELVQEGLGVYRIKTDALQSLQPDLIVTQDQCEVCAVSLPEVEEAVRCFLTPAVKVLSLKPQRLGDIWEDIRQVARATGREDAAEEVLRGLKHRLWKLEQQTRHLSRPRVACIEWIEPLIAAGNWVPELLSIAGGEYDLTSVGEHSPVMTWETLVAYQPEVLILMPCGFPIAQTQREVSALQAAPLWDALPAVKTNNVFIIDGNAYLNRPGPRLVESAEILAEILHPDVCGGLAPVEAYTRVA